MQVRLFSSGILVSLVIGGIFLFCPDAHPQDHRLFTQYERQTHAAALPNPRCKPTPYETHITYSELTVFDSGQVVYQISVVTPCLGQAGDPPWALRWDAPSGSKSAFRYTLATLEFSQFRAFLDTSEVRAISSFMNAGPGVGDFKIAIARPTGIQNIEVLSLMPNHIQLVESPALVQLICKAKNLGRIASNSADFPDWCKDVKPLNGLGPR